MISKQNIRPLVCGNEYTSKKSFDAHTTTTLQQKHDQRTKISKQLKRFLTFETELTNTYDQRSQHRNCPFAFSSGNITFNFSFVQQQKDVSSLSFSLEPSTHFAISTTIFKNQTRIIDEEDHDRNECEEQEQCDLQYIMDSATDLHENLEASGEFGLEFKWTSNKEELVLSQENLNVALLESDNIDEFRGKVCAFMDIAHMLESHLSEVQRHWLHQRQQEKERQQQRDESNKRRKKFQWRNVFSTKRRRSS